MRVLSALDCYTVQLRADGRSPFTLDQIKRHIAFLDRWLAEHRLPRDVRRIKHQHVARFLASPEANTRRDGSPKKATSTNALRSSVRTFFAYVHAAAFAPRNAAELVRRAKCAPPPPRAMPPDDVKRLLATVDAAEGWAAERDSALLHVLAETGARIGSVLSATVENLDLPHGELLLRRTKGDRPTVISLRRGLCHRLRTHLGSRTTGPLFSTSNGRPLGGRQARRRLELWLTRAGCRRANLHSLRHAYAEAVYARTGDILQVQRALRHACLRSSEVYLSAV
jgi:site-specific recombinase XerD